MSLAQEMNKIANDTHQNNTKLVEEHIGTVIHSVYQTIKSTSKEGKYSLLMHNVNLREEFLKQTNGTAVLVASGIHRAKQLLAAELSSQGFKVENTQDQLVINWKLN
jgi:hypothetical protein